MQLLKQQALMEFNKLPDSSLNIALSYAGCVVADRVHPLTFPAADSPDLQGALQHDL